jgi:hypothetical protein
MRRSDRVAGVAVAAVIVVVGGIFGAPMPIALGLMALALAPRLA